MEVSLIVLDGWVGKTPPKAYFLFVFGYIVNRRLALPHSLWWIDTFLSEQSKD